MMLQPLVFIPVMKPLDIVFFNTDKICIKTTYVANWCNICIVPIKNITYENREVIIKGTFWCKGTKNKTFLECF